MAIVYWIHKGVLLVDCMQQGNHTVWHGNSYELPLNRLWQRLLTKGVFLLHDKDESWMILQNTATTPTFNYPTVNGTNTFILTEPRLAPCRAKLSTPASWHDNVWHATTHSCYDTNGTRHNRLLNGVSNKFYKAPEHLVVENPLAIIQTAMVPSI